jgi:PEP-CTERM motif
MTPPQIASIVVLGFTAFWFFSPDHSAADTSGSGGPVPLPVQEAPLIAKVRSALGTPSVQLDGKDSPWTEVGLSYELRAGSTIVTDFGEELVLELASGGQITLGPGSLLETAIGPDGTPTLRLQRGKLAGFVEGEPVEFVTAMGGGLLLDPNPGQRVNVMLGDRPSPIVGIAPAPWISDDWSLFDPGTSTPLIYRGFTRGAPIPVIPEPGTVGLLALGLLGVMARSRAFRKVPATPAISR